jgi:tripartite ATP-independent transporter DctM subunit
MPLSEKLVATARYVLPIALVIFLVVGVIFLGIATPSEAAASGVLGIFILAALYRRLDWKMVKKSFRGTIEIAVMVFMIIAAARGFGQNLAFTGATRGLVEFIVSLPFVPIIIFIIIQVIVVIMGMFMEPASIIMITLPVFMPVIHSLGFDPVWFAIVMLLNIQLGMLSPPFGMSLFVMKGVAPPDTTMGDVYRAALPFFALNLVGMALVIAFPVVALWLPGLMR